jgi:hypothetical protein
MPALPTKKELLEMKRPDLQRLCKVLSNISLAHSVLTVSGLWRESKP